MSTIDFNDSYTRLSLHVDGDVLKVIPVVCPKGVEVEAVEPAVEDDWEDHMDWQNFYNDPPTIG